MIHVTPNLNPQQIRFCEEYLVSFNAYRAAKAAGYSENTARKGEILGLPKIEAYLRLKQQERAERLEISHDKILREYAKIAFANMGNYYDERGDLKPMCELSESDKAAINFSQTMNLTEPDRFIIGKMTKLKLHNKMAALDRIAKHLGFFGANGVVGGELRVAGLEDGKVAGGELTVAGLEDGKVAGGELTVAGLEDGKVAGGELPVAGLEGGKVEGVAVAVAAAVGVDGEPLTETEVAAMTALDEVEPEFEERVCATSAENEDGYLVIPRDGKVVSFPARVADDVPDERDLAAYHPDIHELLLRGTCD